MMSVLLIDDECRTPRLDICWIRCSSLGLDCLSIFEVIRIYFALHLVSLDLFVLVSVSCS